MGADITRDRFDEAEFANFGAKLERNLEALQALLRRPSFGLGPMSLGAELELNLVDAEPVAVPSRGSGSGLSPAPSVVLSARGWRCAAGPATADHTAHVPAREHSERHQVTEIVIPGERGGEEMGDDLLVHLALARLELERPHMGRAARLIERRQSARSVRPAAGSDTVAGIVAPELIGVTWKCTSLLRLPCFVSVRVLHR